VQIHVSNSNGDMKSRDLMTLLMRDRACAQQTIRQQIAWRMDAEAIVSQWQPGKDTPQPEPLYRIEWVRRLPTAPKGLADDV
jgi:paired amphipathic helix protein Sin3a